MSKVIIDVREPHEFARGHVKGAINLPPSRLMDPSALSSIPKDAEIIVYCISGSRSAVTKNILQRLGYTNVSNGINKDHVERQIAII